MKAAVVEGYNDIRYKNIPEPKIVQGTVKVRVKYCGICGSDIPRVLKGACHSFPQVLGHEFSGIVDQVSPGISTVKVGDHVVGIPLVPCMRCQECEDGYYSLCENYSFIGSRQQGAMAEFVVVPESNVFRIDDSINLDSAALFEPSTVALHGVLINNFAPGPEDNVLIIGAGTIALFTIQWCKLLGANHIIVLGRNRERTAISRKYGASNTISSIDVDYLEQAMKISNGKGYQYVFDAAGTPETLKASILLAANKANVCIIGTPTHPVCFTVKEWETINRREMHITGSWMSYSKPWPGKEWQMTAEYLSNGLLYVGEDMIAGRIPLSNIKEVFSQFENNRKSINGRLLIQL